MSTSDLQNLPPFYQLAAGLGITLGVAGGIFAFIWLKLGLNKLTTETGEHGKKIQEISDQHAQDLADRDLVWQTKMEAALKAQADENAKNSSTMLEQAQKSAADKLVDIQKKYDANALIKEGESTRQLQAIAENFAKIQSQQIQTLENNQIALTNEIAQREAMEQENALLQETMENVNKSLRSLEERLDEREREDKRLKKIYAEKDEKEKVQTELIVELRREISLLQESNRLLEARIQGMLDFAHAQRLTIEEEKHGHDTTKSTPGA